MSGLTLFVVCSELESEAELLSKEGLGLGLVARTGGLDSRTGVGAELASGFIEVESLPSF